MASKAQSFDLNALYPTDAERPVADRAPAAWMATKVLMMAIGGMSTVAYLAAMPWWLVAAGAGIAGVTWLCLYKLLREWSERSRETH